MALGMGVWGFQNRVGPLSPGAPKEGLERQASGTRPCLDGLVTQKRIFFKPLPSAPGGGWGQILLRRMDRKRGGSMKNKIGSLRKEKEFGGQQV